MNRKEEMKRLRFEEFKTLQEIANIYNLSRERVRQIVGNTGSFVTDKKTREKIDIVSSSKNITNNQLIEIMREKFGGTGRTFFMRGTFRHKLEPDSWAAHGAKYEDLVSEKLLSLGIENKQMPHSHPFDILLGNGKKVDVKACLKKRITSPSQKHTMYAFSTRKKKKQNYCDFFICYIVPENAYFIIPESEVPCSDYLYIAYPTPERSWAKWNQYENRFDLLQ